MQFSTIRISALTESNKPDCTMCSKYISMAELLASFHQSLGYIAVGDRYWRQNDENLKC